MKKKPAKGQNKAASKPSVLPQDLARLMVDSILAAARREESGYAEKFFENGPNAVSVLAWLAREPNNMLAAELAGPAITLVRAIGDFTAQAQRVAMAAKKLEREEWQKAAEVVLNQLHFALALISRNLRPMVRLHGRLSKNADLLCEATSQAIGDGDEAANLLEHYAEILTEEFRIEGDRAEPDSWPDQFAWDAYLRIAALDDLAGRFPAHLKTAARVMNAWPMLRYRHTDSKARFESLAEKLELGADYPLDTSKTARFRPDTPMVRYLDGIVYRLHCFRQSMGWSGKREEDRATAIARIWREPGEPAADATLVTVLRAALDAEPLTKRSAPVWAKKVIVPLILVTAGRDYLNCKEPALKAIAHQNGVKSVATFKSRLLAAVIPTLTSMARPG